MTGAVVLAAGRGTRLGALGARMPKTMIPVAGRPYLEHLAGRLLGAGLYPVVVAVNHHADLIVNHFSDHPLSTGIRFVYTGQKGTGPDLLQCLGSLHSEDFVVWNGDTVVDIDLTMLLDDRRDTESPTATGCRAVLALSRRPNVPNQDAWFVSADSHILGSLESDSRWVPPVSCAWRGSSTGVVLLSKTLLVPFHSRVTETPQLYSGILPELIRREQLRAFDNGYRYFLDFGTRERLAQLDHTRVAGWTDPATLSPGRGVTHRRAARASHERARAARRDVPTSTSGGRGGPTVSRPPRPTDTRPTDTARRHLAAVPRRDPSGGSARIVENEHAYRRLVGQRVRLQRQWLDVSHERLARTAALTPAVVDGIEHGRSAVNAWRLGLLADSLGVTPDWLLDRATGRIVVPGPAPQPTSGGSSRPAQSRSDQNRSDPHRSDHDRSDQDGHDRRRVGVKRGESVGEDAGE